MAESKLSGADFQDVLDPREPDLLQNPAHNASELYEIYREHIDTVLDTSDVVIEREEVELFLEACRRQQLIARLLPREDLRRHKILGKRPKGYKEV